MKTYEETVKSVFERSEKIIKKKAIRRRYISVVATLLASSLILVALSASAIMTYMNREPGDFGFGHGGLVGSPDDSLAITSRPEEDSDITDVSTGNDEVEYDKPDDTQNDTSYSEEEDTLPGDDISKDEPINPTNIRDLSWYDGGVAGAGGGIIYTSDGSDGFGLYGDAKKTLFDNLLVYTDNFPIDDAGAHINEATEEQKSRMIELHTKFMQYYSDTWSLEYSLFDFLGNPYEKGYDSAISQIDGIGIRTHHSGYVRISEIFLNIDKTTDLGDIKDMLTENAALKAACLYLGIDDPVINTHLQYNSSGELLGKSFKIHQRGSTEIEDLYNSNLRYILIDCDRLAEYNSAMVHICSPDLTGEELGEYKLIPYEEAVANVLEGNCLTVGVGGKIDEEDLPSGELLGVDIVYETIFKQGYNIPFYRFAFVKKYNVYTNSDLIDYSYYYFPAVEFHLG